MRVLFTVVREWGKPTYWHLDHIPFHQNKWQKGGMLVLKWKITKDWNPVHWHSQL